MYKAPDSEINNIIDSISESTYNDIMLKERFSNGVKNLFKSMLKYAKQEKPAPAKMNEFFSRKKPATKPPAKTNPKKPTKTKK
jgi:hypothetical protein